jgi:transposase-like protein
MGRDGKFSDEVRDRAVRLVQECRAEHSSEWSAIVSVASKIGCGPESLRKWIRKAEGQRGAVSRSDATADRERLKALEREVFELRRANEILRKASAYFAQAELDRRPK